MAQKCSDKNIVTLCLSYANSSCYENQKNAQKRYSLTKTNQMMIIKKKITFQRKTAIFQRKWLKKYERIQTDIQTNSKKKVKPNPDSEQLPEIWFYQNLFLGNL